ncbi:phage integrase N-terminal SAM-like domain-containing protein [Colwellia sp. BRX10-4]|uniref:phage integrase N-terminal SAM-like domain-containing protein n=1 Tax=Colwellia sp. BRX10-4 TaxID=2759843 RepID=UPI00217509F1
MGEQKVSNYLNYLAVDGQVTSSTQNLALCSIVFMYKHVFKRELTLLSDKVRARARTRMPMVLSNQEATAIIKELKPLYHLIFSLLYGWIKKSRTIEIAYQRYRF